MSDRRDLLWMFLVAVAWLFVWMLAIGGALSCASAPKREAYRFDMVDDCKNHCEQVGKSATVDQYRMECVCEVSK